MKTHRSLKNILLPRSRFQEELKIETKSTFSSITGSASGLTLNL